MNQPNSRPQTFVLGSGLRNVPSDVGGICLVFDREEMANPRIGRSVEDLMYLSNSRAHCLTFANSVFYVFAGYDDDPRELHDIPEVRHFLSLLHARWPCWLHFFAPIPDLWSTFLLCLIPTADRVAVGEGRFARRHDPSALKALVFAQIQAMNDLHQLHGIDTPTRQRIFKTSMSAIHQVTAPDPEAPKP
jgi:hypothetical protein